MKQGDEIPDKQKYNHVLI